MADYDINQPNDYVPDDTLPPSAIGKGGLSAMNAASHGSPMAPRLMGGLQSEGGQQKLEDTLYSRIRSPEQIQAAADERRGVLSKLQAAIAQPSNNYTGLEMIARGMAHNSQPWDVGNGFREGIADAYDNDAKRQKERRDAGIQSALAEDKFVSGEEGINDKMEANAITNLRQLAKPLMARGGLGGGSSGVRFKNVPGVGLVDTWQVDPDSGIPKVVYPDGKTLSETRMKARKIAEAEAESQQNNMTFNSDAERNAFIERRADQIVGTALSGTVPGAAAGVGVPPAPQKPRGGAPSGPAAPIGAAPKNAGFAPGVAVPGTGVDDSGRYTILAQELASAKREGRANDVASIQREIDALPANEKPANVAADGSPKIEGPEAQRGRIKTAEKVADNQADSVKKLQDDAQSGLNMVSTVNELRQLKFNPGVFAKWQQRGGNLLEALGNNGPLAKMAAQSSNAEALLTAMSNARISLEHGVQTKDDEIRFKNELAKITDPREAYEYMLKHMVELGTKAQDQYNFVEDYRKAHGGTTYDGAQQAWMERTKQYGGMVKRYQGNFIGRSEFIDHIVNDPANVAAYKGDTAKLRQRAEKEWNNLGSK